MAKQTNFLLGYGERLTATITATSGGGPKIPPYTFGEAKTRLLSKAIATSEKLDALPKLACPADRAVAKITLHPQYIAKSYFPAGLIREAGFSPLGSRPDSVRPEKWTRKGEPEVVETTTLFIDGPRREFRSLPARLSALSEQAKIAPQIISIEDFGPYLGEEKIGPGKLIGKEPVVEIVLHASARSKFVIDGFLEFAKLLNFDVPIDDRFYVGSLCFVPARIPKELLRQVADFAYVRFLRQMPKLRTMRPETPKKVHSFPCALPTISSISDEPRMAIFDGGLVGWTRFLNQ